MVQLDEKLLIKSTHSYFLVTMVANSSKITLLVSHKSDEQVACFRNGWKQKVIFLDHMAAATSMSWEMLLVELPSVLLHGGKSWYFLSFSLPSHAQALSWAHRAASSLWGSGLSLVIRSMGNSTRL